MDKVLNTMCWLRQRRNLDSGTGSSQAFLQDPRNKTEGRPILVVKNGDSFELDERALRKVLYQNHVKDKKVVVVSVAGAYRRGKSFLLDFLLRYLRAEGRPDWMGPDDIPLEGFPWRYGSSLHTTGILIWSEVFLSKLPNGEEVAVILMDTQGVFDSESTVQDYANIFALSTLLSSVQIYNLMHNIQEDDLQHLQLFAEYGRLALEHGDSPPFQKLQFLVRDWSFSHEFEYGDVGGKKLLEERLKISQNQNAELKLLRQHITSCFSDISCFLMPHPGGTVTTVPEFNGRLSDIESEFKTNLQRLVPLILAPDSLMVKKIGGKEVTAKELVTYFKLYFKAFSGNKLPKLKSLFLITVEANNLVAVSEATNAYKQEMKKVCFGRSRTPYVDPALLISQHERIKEKVLLQFNSKKTIGGEKYYAEYRATLENDLDSMFATFEEKNQRKYEASKMAGLVDNIKVKKVVFLVFVTVVVPLVITSIILNNLIEFLTTVDFFHLIVIAINLVVAVTLMLLLLKIKK